MNYSILIFTLTDLKIHVINFIMDIFQHKIINAIINATMFLESMPLINFVTLCESLNILHIFVKKLTVTRGKGQGGNGGKKGKVKSKNVYKGLMRGGGLNVGGVVAGQGRVMGER